MASASCTALILLIAAFATVESTKLTYYWVVHETEFRPLGSDATLATCSGQFIASTSRKFAERIATEGSGYLRDNKTVLNLGSCVDDSPCKPKNGKYSCFIKGTTPLGSQNNPLAPFVSIASNQIPFGTTGIVSQFKDKTLPNNSGKKHNGCVRVDDTCSTCTKGQDWIDFYVVTVENYNKIQSTWGSFENVDFKKTNCKPGTYDNK